MFTGIVPKMTRRREPWSQDFFVILYIYMDSLQYTQLWNINLYNSYINRVFGYFPRFFRRFSEFFSSNMLMSHRTIPINRGNDPNNYGIRWINREMSPKTWNSWTDIRGSKLYFYSKGGWSLNDLSLQFCLINWSNTNRSSEMKGHRGFAYSQTSQTKVLLWKVLKLNSQCKFMVIGHRKGAGTVKKAQKCSWKESSEKMVLIPTRIIPQT